jgi:hypothetical protein
LRMATQKEVATMIQEALDAAVGGNHLDNFHRVMSPSKGLKVKTLNKTMSFLNWSRVFIIAMKDEGLDRFFLEEHKDESSTDAGHVFHERKKNLACGRLLSLIDDDVTEVIKTKDDLENPRKMWMALEEHFVGVTAYTRREARAELATLKMTGSMSLVTFINTIKELGRRIGGDERALEETLFTAFMVGLHPRYKAVKNDIQLSETPVTFLKACEKALLYHRLNFGVPSEAIGEDMSPGSALIASTKKEKLVKSTKAKGRRSTQRSQRRRLSVIIAKVTDTRRRSVRRRRSA